MSVRTKTVTSIAFIGTMFVSACGGGGGGGGDDDGGNSGITGINEASNVAVIAVSTNTSNPEVTTTNIPTNTSTFDPNNVLSQNRDFVRFVDGNTLAAAEAPTAVSATYTGSALVSVDSGGSGPKIEGTMVSVFTVNLGSADADLALNTLTNATEDNGSGPTTYTPNGTEVISINDLHVSVSEFFEDLNSTISADNFGGVTTNLAGTPNFDAAGVFAGPSATEVAGGAITDGGEVTLIFTGER